MSDLKMYVSDVFVLSVSANRQSLGKMTCGVRESDNHKTTCIGPNLNAVTDSNVTMFDVVTIMHLHLNNIDDGMYLTLPDHRDILCNE